MIGTKNIFNPILTTAFSVILYAYIFLTPLAQAQDTPTPPENSTTEGTTTPPPQVEQLPVTRRTVEQLREVLLQNEVKEEEIVLIGPEQKLLALWRPQTSAQPLGAVLFLHDDGQHPDWPKTLRPPRTSFPQFGWSTLSISLPESQPSAVPPRPTHSAPIAPKGDSQTTTESEEKSGASKDQHAEETEKLMQQDSEVDTQAQAIADENTSQNNTPTDQPLETFDAEMEAVQRIEQAMGYLNEQGQFNIIIVAYGTAAHRALTYLERLSGGGANAGMNLKVQGKTQRPVRAMVLVSPRNEINHDAPKLTNLLNDKEIPILDVFFRQYFLEEQEAQVRREYTRENNFSNYFQQQLAVPDTQLDAGESPLSRRIRGFLNKHAKGVEVGG